jgi:hypothetical protein
MTTNDLPLPTIERERLELKGARRVDALHAAEQAEEERRLETLRLDETCPHGLSAWLCTGPNHYDLEMRNGW